MNLSLLGSIFFYLLLGMMLGMGLLASNIQRIPVRFHDHTRIILLLELFVHISLDLQDLFEKGLTFACLFWEKEAIRSLVGKNLIAHRRRNGKTAIMYALSLGKCFILSSLSLSFSLSLYEKK
jgi:hypothetical protein